MTWTLAFSQMAPVIAAGSVIEPNGIHCGAPCTFLWPSGWITAGGLTIYRADTVGEMLAYKVPGEVRLAILPTGDDPANEDEDPFTAKGTLNLTTGAFSGKVTRPADPGAYTIWARSCWGAGEPTCVVATSEIAV